VVENPCLYFYRANESYAKRFLTLYPPLDPVIYNNPGCKRDIGVSFLGQVDSYRSYRTLYIQHVINNGPPIYTSLSQRAMQPSHVHYMDVLKRSRIGLNFSYSVDAHQLKGRVFETMLCGAMLMESENAQTSRYFTPMKDYISFDSKEDLVDKLRYYLKHEDERAEIAARGELKVRKQYNYFRFWKEIMNKLE